MAIASAQLLFKHFINMAFLQIPARSILLDSEVKYRGISVSYRGTRQLSLHLLQMCVVHVNTLMIQQVLSAATWQSPLEPEDLRGLTPLIYGILTLTAPSILTCPNGWISNK